MLGFFLDCSSLHFLRQGLSLNPGLTNLARLSCQHTPEIQLFLYLRLESQLHVILPGFFPWVLGIQTALCACVANPSPTESSFQLHLVGLKDLSLNRVH